MADLEQSTIHTRCLLVGDTSVGKTAYTELFNQMTENKLACPQDSVEPSRFDYKKHTLQFIEANDTNNLDTRQFDCVIVFFSVIDMDSFNSAIGNIQDIVRFDKPFILCGTHVDHKHIAVSQKHVNNTLKEYMEKHKINIKYTRISNRSRFQYYKPVLYLVHHLHIEDKSYIKSYYSEPALHQPDPDYAECAFAP